MNAYDRIARFYELEHENFVDDVEFYMEMVLGPRVLELGSGTGRVMGPLLNHGLEVWGVDASRVMTVRARERLGNNPRATIVDGELEMIDENERFNTILASLNFLWHVTRLEDRLALLRRSRALLEPGGRVIVDLSNPLTLADRGAKGDMRQRFVATSGQTDLRGWSSCWDDEADQLLTLDLVYDEVSEDGTFSRTAAQFSLRYLFRNEAELSLHAAGFPSVSVYGSYNQEPYTAESPNLILVAGV